MNIGSRIQNIRKDKNMTQEEFGKLFYVTRQTVSNWENEKSYPDLQVLVKISDMFNISLDKLLKEDENMVKAIDRQRMAGTIKRRKKFTDMLIGAGTGIVISCLFSSSWTDIKIALFIAAVVMINVGWYLDRKDYKKIMEYLEDEKAQEI